MTDARRLALAGLLALGAIGAAAFLVLARPVPDVVGEPTPSALSDLRASGFVVDEHGSGEIAIREVPAAGEVALPGAHIALFEGPR